jgi:hypothetical protein
MPYPLILNRNLNPDKNIKFVINVLLGDIEMDSRIFDLQVPTAAPLMSRVGKDFTYRVLVDQGEEVTRSKSWNIERYRKIKIGSSFCIQLRLQDDDSGYKELNKKDKPKVTFNTSGSTFLSALNNRRGTFVEKTRNNSGDILVTFQIEQDRWTSISTARDVGQSVNPSTHRITLSETSIAKKTSFRITTSKENIGNKLIRIGNVHDILVFSYRQYDGELNSKVKRKYIGVDGVIQNDEVDSSKTLTYSKAKDLYLRDNKQILNFTKRYDPKDGKKFIVYASIVRYVRKSDGSWNGEWLQVNNNDEPIWARAVVEGS